MKILKNIWEGFYSSYIGILFLVASIYGLFVTYESTGYMAIFIFLLSLLGLGCAGFVFWFIGKCVNSYSTTDNTCKDCKYSENGNCTHTYKDDCKNCSLWWPKEGGKE